MVGRLPDRRPQQQQTTTSAANSSAAAASQTRQIEHHNLGRSGANSSR